jgi:hypothetical protein
MTCRQARFEWQLPAPSGAVHSFRFNRAYLQSMPLLTLLPVATTSQEPTAQALTVWAPEQPVWLQAFVVQALAQRTDLALRPDSLFAGASLDGCGGAA